MKRITVDQIRPFVKAFHAAMSNWAVIAAQKGEDSHLLFATNGNDEYVANALVELSDKSVGGWHVWLCHAEWESWPGHGGQYILGDCELIDVVPDEDLGGPDLPVQDEKGQP